MQFQTILPAVFAALAVTVAAAPAPAPTTYQSTIDAKDDTAPAHSNNADPFEEASNVYDCQLCQNGQHWCCIAPYNCRILKC
jgi:hypothetical protein